MSKVNGLSKTPLLDACATLLNRADAESLSLPVEVWEDAREEMCDWFEAQGKPRLPFASRKYDQSHFLVRNKPVFIGQDREIRCSK